MKEKLISFCVPSYNSESYLHRALDSLVPGGEKVEILVIDDGSKDRTLKIAREYQEKYPGIVKAVHQENKGHGGAINTALSLASGRYFKVVDSDDFVEKDGLSALLKAREDHRDLDRILRPYTYRHGEERKKGKTIRYGFFVKKDTVVSIGEIKRFDAARNLTLHSVVYSTSLLRDKAKLVLPEHCFYEDNYRIYAPLPFIKKLRYIDVPFYQYLLGREGQSRQTNNLIKRNKDLRHVAFLSFQSVSLPKRKKTERQLYKLRKHQLIRMVTAPLLYTSRKDKAACKTEKGEFLRRRKDDDLKQYKRLVRHPFVFFPSRNNAFGRISARFRLFVIRKFGAIN